MAGQRTNHGESIRRNQVCQSDDKESYADGPLPLPLSAIQQIADRPTRSRVSCATLSDAERIQLLDWSRSRTLPHRLVVRSRIILLASDGLTIRQVATRLHISPTTVLLWCRRFSRDGTGALTRDRPRGGRQPGRSATRVTTVLRAMRERGAQQPPWTTRTLAKSVGLSAATVWRIWKQCHVGPTSSSAEIDRAIAQVINETRDRAR